MIDDIIKYEDDNTYEKKLEKIKIKGTSLNDEYSLISFNQNTANVHIKNLSFESTLSKTTLNKDEININDYESDILPTTEQIFLLYPLEIDNKPYIADSFKTNIKKNNVKPTISEINTYMNSISNWLSSVQLTANIVLTRWTNFRKNEKLF